WFQRGSQICVSRSLAVKASDEAGTQMAYRSAREILSILRSNPCALPERRFVQPVPAGNGAPSLRSYLSRSAARPSTQDVLMGGRRRSGRRAQGRIRHCSIAFGNEREPAAEPGLQKKDIEIR